MVSNASEDLPEPLGPVKTIDFPSGSRRSMSFRLFCRTPLRISSCTKVPRSTARLLYGASRIRSSLCHGILQAMHKNPRVMLGVLLAAVLLIGATIALGFDIFFRVPDFTVIRSAVKVPIILENGDESFKMIDPRVPGWVALRDISRF